MREFTVDSQYTVITTNNCDSHLRVKVSTRNFLAVELVDLTDEASEGVYAGGAVYVVVADDVDVRAAVPLVDVFVDGIAVGISNLTVGVEDCVQETGAISFDRGVDTCCDTHYH